jgi:hydrogenase maturation protein HypF
MIGVRSRISYEGQAAIELEALAEEADTDTVYSYGIDSTADGLVLDMRLMLQGVVVDLEGAEPRSVIARRFHNTIARATTDLCEKIRAASGNNRVVLSGGSFQNKLLTEGIFSGLVDKDFEVFTHRLVPPNDGGLALGQAVVAGRQTR